MTKEETDLVEELRLEIASLLKQYQLFLGTRELMLQEIRTLREENEKLKIHSRLNGCYFEREGPILPFKHRG